MKIPIEKIKENLKPSILQIIKTLKNAGGKPYLVGGFVRDLVIGRTPGDADIEVYNMSASQVEKALMAFGAIDIIGKSFGVYKIPGVVCDISLPRTDSKTGGTHRDFAITCDGGMSFELATKRRDFRCNALLLDPIRGDIIDPHGGLEDIAAHRLAIVDPVTFLDDNLRILRFCRFASQLGWGWDNETLALLKKGTLNYISPERFWVEFSKLLLGDYPEIGLTALELCGAIRYFPELDILHKIQQDPQWHPEGNVWIHTKLVVRNMREHTGDISLMLAALCHDMGKASTTKFSKGRIRALGHDEAGVWPARRFLQQIKCPKDIEEKVIALVRNHLAPMYLITGNSGPAGFRRLARKLSLSGATLEELEILARCDSLGRGGKASSVRTCDKFLGKIHELGIKYKAPKDVVMGRHLISLGMEPGKHFRKILDRCREIQYKTGLDSDVEIMKRAGLIKEE